MSTKDVTELPPEQEAIGAKRFNPSGAFVEFPIEDVETSIPARFEKIVKLYPNNLAVKVAERSLTFQALNRYANRLAHAIVETRGTGSEPVALVFENSIDLIAAIIGVLKARKFYVVLDPTSPRERLDYVLQDSGAKLVITDPRDRETALDLAGKDRGLLIADVADETRSPENLTLGIFSNDLACIQYTSGSTGTPKGVVELHANVLQSARWMTEEIQVRTDDRFSLIHSLSFASAYVHLRLSLLNGRSLFGFDTKYESIERLARWLKDERITILHSPPALFRHLAESLPLEGMHPDLRLIRLSGAPITQQDFELYKSRFVSGTRLHIGMGSTEARGICAAIVDDSFSFPAEGAPIGYPPPGKEILLVDETGNEVVRGQVGEIVVKGANLNPRYWNETPATSDKFLPDPKERNKRLYRTGDLGRMLPDGFVIHLGRKDLMLKIRGYRVDISEVERALRDHPDISEAAVRAWDQEPGETSLAGYIVPREGFAPNVSDVREFLTKKLPDYMIPSSFAWIQSLPLTNGKLDRQALPMPARRRPELEVPFVIPRNDLERTLAGIWAEVLQIDEVGIDDNIFDLGGHSLTAARILSRVLDRYRVEVSLKSLFESPTPSGLARKLKSALEQNFSETNLPLIPVSRERNMPASFGQQALWFHDQLDPGSSAYNLVFSYRLRGALDGGLLQRSVDEIVARHEVLRTAFESVDGQPVQIILPAATIDLPVIDLSCVTPESVQESQVRSLAGGLARHSFDLARGPLLRTALLRLAQDEYVFLLAIHHVVFDAWSIGVFVGELSQIYNSRKSGKPCPLTTLHIQYADFALWQRSRLDDANLGRQLSYWRDQLTNLPTLSLPIRKSQPPTESPSGGREEFAVSDELLGGLRVLTDGNGTTLFMVLLAAWMVALHRYSGQTDIAIGTPVAGRNHPEVEGLIGYFLNMLVLRIDLSGNPRFRELLERIRRVCVDAFAHQDLPFERLVEELRPARHPTNNPLVQVTFALQNTPKQTLNLTGIAAQDLDISAEVARPFDLHLYMIEEAICLRAYVSYNRELFKTDTIQRLIGHLQNLLTSIVANQDERIAALPMLSEREKHQLLVEWNDTRTSYPKDKCIHELFEERVERTPEAVAVVFEDQQLTYRELNWRVNQLAHHLRRQGVRPETLIALFMERSSEIVIAILGVLKAGAAYLPIDPDLPDERSQFLLRDANVDFILTQEKFRVAVADCAKHIIFLDSEPSELSLEDRSNPAAIALGHHAAYVIYTSGSTGAPKGVVNTHDGLRNRIQWMQQAYTLDASDRVLQKTPYTFDVSLWEFLWPLSSGASLVLARPGGQRDSAYLAELIQSQEITTLHFVPSMLAAFLEEPGMERCSSLRHVFASGEALPHNLQQRFFERTSAALHNLYGPTEASIDVTAWQCQRDHRTASVPIGRPIANTQIYILDGHLNPVPIGVPGEIYIGGAGLARGYLNRPELTAQRFIANPFGAEPGARLYKTGDLARYRADGNIEFLGRMDDQVKIRGYRIELGEIEAVLGQHASVKECVVSAREDSPEDKRLVSYVVGADANVDELRSHLRRKLPEYMVPFAFVLLDSLPLTPNGKVDRNALPAPDQTRPETAQSYVAPRTVLEERLANIWTKVLKLDKIGIDDNFFQLGGHSLLATQVVSRVREALQVELPLRALFEQPTVAGLAAEIESAHAKKDGGGEMSVLLEELESLSDEEAKQRLNKSGIALLKNT